MNKTMNHWTHIYGCEYLDQLSYYQFLENDSAVYSYLISICLHISNLLV